MTSQTVQNVPVATPSEDAEAEALPFLAKVLNHLLTPGSSLNPIIWTAFNIIMSALFLIWLMFVFAMPDVLHVWIFGVLLLGLAVSTNWLMRIVFSEGLDFASQQKEREAQRALSNGESGENKTEEAKKAD